MNKIILILSLCLVPNISFDQVGIGTNSPETNSVLDVHSETKGFLPPRMDTEDRDDINGGIFAEGLIIYNTDHDCLNFYNGTVWINICSSETPNIPLPNFDNSVCITAADGVAGDRFGVDLDLSEDGSRLIVGADYNDTKKGSAYVYRKDGANWVEEAQLTAAVRTNDDFFGRFLRLTNDGETAIIGAPGKDGEKGAVYIYTRSGTTWTPHSILTANDGVAGNRFGDGLSITADASTIILGAPGWDGNKGASYVFVKGSSGWTQQAKLLPTIGSVGPFDNFGVRNSLSADGNRAIVSSWGVDNYNGAAYVYSRTGTTWSSEAKISTNNAVDDFYFSNNAILSSDGESAIIGYTGRNDRQGSVYTFTRNSTGPTPTWTEQSILVPADAASPDNFGAYLDASTDDSVFVSGLINHSGLGYAYVYKHDGTSWVEHKKLIEPDLSNGDLYGSSVAIAPNKSIIAIGSRKHNSIQGRVCIYY